MLTSTQIAKFVRDGFLTMPELVPPRLVEALRVRALREYPALLPQSAATENHAGGIVRTIWPEQEAVFQEGGIYAHAELLLGAIESVFSHLVVLERQADRRFPFGALHVDRPPVEDRRAQWPTFSLNVGVAIQGGQRRNSGSVGVYPGTHRLYQDYFRRHPTLTLWDCMTGAHHPKTKRPLVQLPPVALPPVVELTASPGTAWFMHSMLAHTSMPNTTPLTRIAVYFRVIHPQHHAAGNEFVRNIWSYWPEKVRNAITQ